MAAAPERPGATGARDRVWVRGFGADIEILPETALVMRRHLTRDLPTLDIDAYGRGWMLGEVVCRRGQMSFSHGGRDVLAPRTFWFVIRPFSIVAWRLTPGDYELTMFISRRPFPARLAAAFPAPATMLTGAAGATPAAHADAERILAAAAGADAATRIAIDKEDSASPGARAIKRALDRDFQQELSLAELARGLGMAPAVLSRRFKACYGVTPKSYLNQIRASDSMWDLIVSHASATAIGYASGFNDHKQFHGHLRRYARAAPSDFRPPR